MKKSIQDLFRMYREKEPIAWVTSYDYPLAMASEKAGVDMILVGDSGGMCMLGYTTTNPVTMDEMILMAKAVRRGAPNTFIVGDMPQGSYEVSDEEAVKSALRFVKEAGVDAVKLEGGSRVSDRVGAIVAAGILVIGHLGLTPQSSASLGGYKVQGTSQEEIDAIILDAGHLASCGASIILLEAMPDNASKQIRKAIGIPLMGIGAGKEVDGQLLIIHDLLGLHQPFRPKFAKCYVPTALTEFADKVYAQTDLKKFGIVTREDGLFSLATIAVRCFVEEVKSGMFPTEGYIYQ